MNRVKIKLEGQKIFSTQITLAVNDMNYGNHMGNERVLCLAHEARLRFLASIKATELDCFGQSLIMSDAMIEYRGEGFRGDIVTIDLYLAHHHERGFDLQYDMYTDSKPIARVKSGMLFFDYEKRKVAKASAGWIKYVELV